MDDSTLAGRSILVVEEQPFVARCLQILFRGAGAEVHCAASAGEALRIIEMNRLSAAVLDSSKSAKGRRRVAQQLARLGLPFVLCKDAGHDELWPGTPVFIKPVMGFQLVEALSGLIHAQDVRIQALGMKPVREPVSPKTGFSDRAIVTLECQHEGDLHGKS